jgi:hypothetical protein
MTGEKRSPSGTILSDCPKCQEAGEARAECDLCLGAGRVGLSLAIEWLLRHGKTDPPSSA